MNWLKIKVLMDMFSVIGILVVLWMFWTIFSRDEKRNIQDDDGPDQSKRKTNSLYWV